MAVHLPLGYEPVAAPCSLMKCGDVLHRSTLDMVLRGEQVGPDWRTFVLLATVGAFLFAPPGIVPGAIDYYILSRLKNMSGPQYGKDDIVLGRKLATGGFGTVFRGELKQTDGKMLPVVVKKATEFGQAEAWMNERTQRLPGKPAAEFITAFDEEQPGDVVPQGKKLGAVGEGIVWLVWKYEGDNTLSKVMESKEFPYNLERMLLKRQLRLPKGVQRQAVTIRLAFKQLLEALAALHITGIVHRDIKPQNCIVSDEDRKIKLIDLGAAADLRVGINYAPSEYLLDPRYAPPQQYIMSTQTPKPPPAPVAALLSPILWRMEHPDRFDMWSCGVTLMQMCFPSLRNDNNLIAFNKKLQALGYDLRKWRAEVQAKGMNKDTADGFALLDLDDGAGWNLLCDLMAFKPTDRCTAAEALQSRFFADPPPAVAASRTAFNTATKAINKTLDSEMFSSFASSATGEDRGSLTEAQLRQELGLDDTPTQAPMASNTIVWWKERQNQMRKSIEKREGSQGTREAGLPMKGTSPGKNSNGVDRAGKNGNGVDRGVSPPAAPAPVAPPAAKAGGFAAMISGQWAKDIRASMDRFSMDGDDDEKPKQKPKVPGPEDYRGVESVDVDPEPEEVEVVMAGQPASAGRFGFLGNMLRKPDAVKK